MSARKSHPSVFSPRHIERRQRAAFFNRRKLRYEPLEDRRMLAVITVNTLSDTTNLNDNLTTLREAIFAANIVPGADEIQFAIPGDGLKTITLKEGEIKITDSLTITGLGADKLTIDASGNDTTPELKDGKGSRIFNIMGPKEGEKLKVSISGLKLTGGDTTTAGGAISSSSTNLTIAGSTIMDNASVLTAGGGGLYHSGGNLSIVESRITGNLAGTGSKSAAGGGIFVNQNAAGTAVQTVQIRGSEISNNTATVVGGGISILANASTAVTITDTHISSNTVSQGGAGGGGGMSISGSGRTTPTLSIEHVTFDHNTSGAVGSGGGLLVTAVVNVTIAASDFSSNTAGGSGGGIYAGERTKLTLSGSTFTNNTAVAAGGGVSAVTEPGTLGSPTNRFSFTGNTFAGNSVTRTGVLARGGGLYLNLRNNEPTTITGNTFRENTAITGGGMYINTSMGIGSKVTISGSTFQSNTASTGGGAAIRSNFDFVIEDSHFVGNKANTGQAAGGGLHLSGGTIGTIIRNSTFENNIAQSTVEPQQGQGGGLFSTPGSVVQIQGSRFASNKAATSGGGMLVGGPVTISGSEIIGNSATGGKGSGGGIYLASQSISAAVTLTDSVISGNTAVLNGGGVYLSSGGPSALFERVKFNENSAGQDGGAIAASAREVVLRSSTLSNNKATRDGGALATPRSGRFSLNNSTLYNNTAGRNGGGASIAQSTNGLTATNSTFSANRATNNGGGIWSDSGATLSYSMLFQNRADQIGGGVYLMAGTGNIRNTVIAGGTAPLGRDISGLLGVTLDLHYSLIGNNQNSGLTPAPVNAPDVNGNIIGSTSGIDPRLDPLSFNGGPTPTHLPLAESPLINHGDPSAIAGKQDVPQFDQRGTGFPRVARDRLDIGAVEVQPIIIAGDFDADGSVDARDFVLALNSNATAGELEAWRNNFGASGENHAAAKTAASSDSANDDNGSASAAASTRSAVPRRPQFATAQTSESFAANEASLLGWVAENSRARPAARAADWSFDSDSESTATGNSTSEAFDEAFAGLAAE